jgi:hypothetical protein
MIRPEKNAKQASQKPGHEVKEPDDRARPEPTAVPEQPIVGEQIANMLLWLPWTKGANASWRLWPGILVARHLKNPEDLHESRPSPRTESLIASAVQWAERIMRRIDGLHHY